MYKKPIRPITKAANTIIFCMMSRFYKPLFIIKLISTIEKTKSVIDIRKQKISKVN
jgi:hypothetical protein